MFCTPAEHDAVGSVWKLLTSHSSPSPASHPPSIGSITANPPEQASAPGQFPPSIMKDGLNPASRGVSSFQGQFFDCGIFASPVSEIEFGCNPSKTVFICFPEEVITEGKAES